jgi:hypothetical protein
MAPRAMNRRYLNRWRLLRRSAACTLNTYEAGAGGPSPICGHPCYLWTSSLAGLPAQLCHPIYL